MIPSEAYTPPAIIACPLHEYRADTMPCSLEGTRWFLRGPTSP